MISNEVYQNICGFSPSPEQVDVFNFMTAFDISQNPLLLRLPCGYGKTESVVVPFLSQAITGKCQWRNNNSVSDSEECQLKNNDSVYEKVTVNSISNNQTLTTDTDTYVRTDTGVYVTASILLEYLFCPRFIYFMNCLCIDQNEEKRFKVLKGREVHDGKERTNIDYLRKKIGCVDKEIGGYIASEKYHIKGIVDEVLTLSDNTMAPLDYKYAEYKDTVFRTQRYQSVFYGLLIKENYCKEVNKGFICYIRSKNLLKEIQITNTDFIELQAMIAEIIDITQKCYYPKGTKFKTQCIDCCYRNICV